MKRIHRISLALLSGILFSLGWYEWGTGLFLLIAFVPLLLVEDDIYRHHTIRKRRKFFFLSALAFVTWNLIATWWIKNATFAGMLAAVFVSAFFMCIPLWFYTVIKNNWGRVAGYFSLIVFWMAYEFAYMHGEVSWPWLVLGDGFMFDIKLIQWYEVTGVFGGTLWVLLANILIYEILRRRQSGQSLIDQKTLIAIAATVVIVPITASLIRYYTYTEKVDPREIVVIQPNVDPYLKFNDIPSLQQTQILIDEAVKLITPVTDYVVCPETSINNAIWIEQMTNVPDIKMIKDFVMKHPGIEFIVGITSHQRYPQGVKTGTSKKLGNTGIYYDSFNSAIQIDSTPNIPIYHKSKLVIGVEKMPYPQYFKVLEPITLRLGGTFRSHGTQKERAVLTAVKDGCKIAPVICYESVYGEYVTDYIKKGADFIFVITNDGWWGNTPGYRQHNALSSLRAIETRRSIARSANTGISAFINQRGDVLVSMGWWERGGLRHSLNANTKQTFYVKHGDYIARGGFIAAMLIILAMLVKLILKAVNK